MANGMPAKVCSPPGKSARVAKFVFPNQQTGSVNAAVANGFKEIVLPLKCSGKVGWVLNESNTAWRSAGQMNFLKFCSVAWSARSWKNTNLTSINEITATAAAMADVG